MRSGVRIGVDVGSVRVGVASCDADALLAVPVATLARESALPALSELVRERSAIEVYVGLPIGLDGSRGAAAGLATEFAAELAVLVAPVPVRLVDERLSTVSAGRALRSAGRGSRVSRAVIDQAAAVVILEHALALERSQGGAPGTLVGEVP